MAESVTILPPKTTDRRTDVADAVLNLTKAFAQGATRRLVFVMRLGSFGPSGGSRRSTPASVKSRPNASSPFSRSSAAPWCRPKSWALCRRPASRVRISPSFRMTSSPSSPMPKRRISHSKPCATHQRRGVSQSRSNFVQGKGLHGTARGRYCSMPHECDPNGAGALGADTACKGYSCGPAARRANGA